MLSLQKQINMGGIFKIICIIFFLTHCGLLIFLFPIILDHVNKLFSDVVFYFYSYKFYTQRKNIHINTVLLRSFMQWESTEASRNVYLERSLAR